MGRRRAALALGFLAALCLRLAFFRAFSENYDTQSYRPGYLVYSVIATVALVSVSGLAPGLPHLPGWYGVWWAAILWLALDLRALARPRRLPA